jgi:hypothetical protein
VNDLDQLVKDWLSAGGNKMRSEFQLELSTTADDHRRLLAVLSYLRPRV